MQKPTFKNKSFTRKQAFTLIELLIVIAIIGILFIVLVSKVDFATDKAKASGVQTDFRSFQMAFDTVAKENAGFNTFGWDTGDANQDGIRNSYDEGDVNKDGIQNGTEVFTGHKVYAETFTKVYSLRKNGTGNYDREALNRLETAINANLDPKLHITIKDDGEIVMANGAKDPWNKEYHGWYITNAETDKKDRGAIVMYSDGANNEFGSEHTIANGVVKVIVPDSNKAGKDDYSIVSLYTYVNGYGEVKNVTTGFSNNQTMLGGNNIEDPGVEPDSPVIPDDPNGQPDNPTQSIPLEEREPGLYQTGSNFTVLLKSWSELEAERIIFSNRVWNDNNDLLDGELLMPADITTISANSFSNCSNLTSVVLPKNCTTIEREAFDDCEKLKTLIMYGNIKEVGGLTNTTIETVKFAGTLKQWCEITGFESFIDGVNEIYIDGELVEHLNFKEHPEITSISSYAFAYYNGLKSVTLSEHLSTDKICVFRGCQNLEYVEINRDINGADWFMSCPNIQTAYVNANLIGQWTFNSSNIQNLYVDKACTIIGSRTFFGGDVVNCYYNGTVDEYVNISINDADSSLAYFGGDKFYINGVLANNITINAQHINQYAFYHCKGLESVTFGPNVESIGQYAFESCKNLHTVTVNSLIEAEDRNFFECYKLINIYVPTDMVETYKAMSVWSSYASKIKAS